MNTSVKPGVTELSDRALAGLLQGEPDFRRVQIRHAVYHGTAQTFADVLTLPRELRTELAAQVRFSTLIEQRTEISQDGTRKILFHTCDGDALEAVQMPGERGSDTTACISSQAGCAMGCTFCATGAVGLTRSLTAAEMVDQFLHLRRSSDPRHTPRRVVFMGMGEPLANLEQVRRAIEVLVDPDRAGLGPRRITVSTVGLPVGIETMAGWGWPLGLAISLHAPVDDLRAELVPPARRISIASLMAASLVYQERTRRRVTYEYTLLDGVNDDPALARRLATLVHGQRCHVNLIPFNPYPGARFVAAPPPVLRAFRDVLREAGVPATIRRTRGRDIAGACGQLQAGMASADASGARRVAPGPGRDIDSLEGDSRLPGAGREAGQRANLDPRVSTGPAQYES